MRTERLNDAIAEAERFLDRAKTLQRERQSGDFYEFIGTRNSGACRRASLDLTRALADLRRL